MSTKFPEYKGLDLPNVANDILQYWQENNIFEKSVSTREGNEPYVFYEGPPSANGLPGVHHVLARAIKDIFCRYKTQKGFQVKRKAGWDTHGLPIELGVEKELGITKEDIGKTISVEEMAVVKKDGAEYLIAPQEDLILISEFWLEVGSDLLCYISYQKGLFLQVYRVYRRSFYYFNIVFV